jgi:hypothetical protein
MAIRSLGLQEKKNFQEIESSIDGKKGEREEVQLALR